MQVEDDGEGTARVELGSVKVIASGDGMHNMQAGRVLDIELTMFVYYEKRRGKKRYISASINGSYDEDEALDYIGDGDITTRERVLGYTDNSILDTIDEYLENKFELDGEYYACSWSEEGEQDVGSIHLDVDNTKLVKLAMPDIKLK